MAVMHLTSETLPIELRGLCCVNERDVPRLFATIWTEIFRVKIATSTRRRELADIDAFYHHVDILMGRDVLDHILAKRDFASLKHCLLGWFGTLKNETVVRKVDRRMRWETTLKFVSDILFAAATMCEAEALLAELPRAMEVLKGISPNPVRENMGIRSLPVIVIEELYDIFNPRSPRNPFKSEGLKWRNLLIFLLLVRLGIRKGESMLLKLGDYREELDISTSRQVGWITIEGTADYDPRWEAADLKNVGAIRQIGIERELLELIDLYEINFRPRTNHRFLLMSQKNGPLAQRTITDIFDRADAQLSETALKAMSLLGIANVTPHQLRHTCAVQKLREFMDEGNDEDTAISRLRVTFGWSRESEMPRHYAAAYYAEPSNQLWDRTFENFVATLKSAMGD